MKDTLPTLIEIENKGERTYQNYFTVEQDTFLLSIRPVHRMGCHSLTDKDGLVMIELRKKDERYPKGYQFSDTIYKQPAGGRNMKVSIIFELSKALQRCGFLRSNTELTTLSFTEKGKEQAICICK